MRNTRFASESGSHSRLLPFSAALLTALAASMDYYCSFYRTPMTNNCIPVSIDRLAAKWRQLNDVQRGEALLSLREQTSLRALAKRLPSSESHLRNLVCAGQAPLADKILASEGEISTRELVRRSKAAAEARAAADKKALDLKRTKEAQRWSEVIGEWLDANGLGCSHGEPIVNEARRELVEAGRAGRLPKENPFKDKPIEEIILDSRPSPLEVDDVSAVAWYAIWLTRWSYFAIADTEVRDRALGLALNSEMSCERERAFKRK